MQVEKQLHVPVLLSESLAALNIQANGIYIDGTFGRGGHSEAILKILSSEGKLLGLDKDPEAITVGKALASKDTRFSIEQCVFSQLQKKVEERLWQGNVDGILLDIGVSSPQLDNANRGFSFQKDGPLDMRMNPERGISAAHWLATAEQDDIANVLKTLGEERFAKRIAKEIVAYRQNEEINTTQQLAKIITAAIPRPEKHKHPATRTFQAIRIYINNELEELSLVLGQAIEALKSGGRLAVISFHSLEDRIVKRFFRDQARGDDLPVHFAVTADQLNPRIKLIGKAVRASSSECQENPRARSAVLRIAEKC